MVRLSVVVITFNEEANLGRCLESLGDLADDLLVVDSFSTDRTEEIARRFGARFVAHPFAGHVEQKSWATEQAHHPHVLSLDADEALSGDLRESIRAVKHDWKHDGYTFNRLTSYCGTWIRHSGWYPDRKLRLWDRRKGRWAGVNPHDRYVLEPGTDTAHLRGDLLHYSYHSIRQHLEQVNYFTDVMAREAFLAGQRRTSAGLLFRPPWKFLRSYALELGCFDGFHGFVIAVISAHATFLKYAKLRQLCLERSDTDSSPEDRTGSESADRGTNRDTRRGSGQGVDAGRVEGQGAGGDAGRGAGTSPPGSRAS